MPLPETAPRETCPGLPPVPAALGAFAVLLARHLSTETLVLATQVAGEPRQVSLCPGHHPTAAALAAALVPLVDPAAADLGLEGQAGPEGDCIQARITLDGPLPIITFLTGLDHLGLPGGATLAAAHFLRLYEAFLQPGEASPLSFPMADATERALLLGPWTGPPHDPDLTREETLQARFEGTALLHPERPALDEDGRLITYAELNVRANRIAHLLQARGIGKGARVGLWLPRSTGTYAALLGILKAGAAYVPLDPTFPAERVCQVAGDCGMALLITGRSAAAPPGCPALDLEALQLAAQAQPATALPSQSGPDDGAYIIYTSGSTGAPKGVPITHRSVCTLIRAEGRIFNPGPSDRVFQGFSLAFDASVEELWLAFASGACLVVGTPTFLQAGPDLARRLAEARITVLSTVPTLLGMTDPPIPSLRLLILGGEACPPDLVARWSRPGLRLVNTYGPTETTVISTWADLLPGAPVSIGRALPNDRVYVLDPEGQPCPVGVPGELHLAGVGLSEGYLGQPDLTAERFIANPYADGPTTGRLYRTGDRARFLPDGTLAFLGRLDAQVKLRGFRIELGEVEAALSLDPAVQVAAVALCGDQALERLVAYVVLRDGAEVDTQALLRRLRDRLPPYMIPASVEVLATLPTLPSGKVDRRRLPVPAAPTEASEPEDAAGMHTEREAGLLANWTRLFQGRRPSLDEDFFRDLGGHSLLAAAMVSGLRRQRLFEGLAVPDVYAFPTARSLAGEFDTRTKQAPEANRIPAPVPSPWRHRLCGLVQALSLYPLLGFFALQWLTPYMVYSWTQDHDLARLTGIALSLAALALVYPAMFVLSIAAKWLLLGRIRPGRHRLWGFYYWRWWLTHRILAATPLDYLVGTPWLPIFLRLLGARIGRRVHLGTTAVSAFDLVDIGDEASVGLEARLTGYTLEDGWLEIGPICLGRRSHVGVRSVVATGARLEDGAVLEDLSLLPAGGRIPAGQRWTGSPARPLPPSETDRLRAATPYPSSSRRRRILLAVAQGLGILLVPGAFLSAIFPGLLLINELYASTNGYFAYLVVAPLVAVSFIVLLALEIAAAKWLLLGRVRSGTYDLQSGFALRKWYVDRLMAMGLDLLAPLYATVYLAPWLRLLGARLGAWAEVSTAGAGTPDLMVLGEDSFIADCVSFGPPQVDLGRVTLGTVQVGRRAFVGNSALIPGGTVLGESVLVGVLSLPPTAPEEAAKVDGSWLGSPAIYLPRRQTTTDFGEAATFRPSRGLYLLRAYIEHFRVILPATGFVILTSLLLTGLTEIEDAWSLGLAAAALPLLYLAAGTLACLFVVAVKWLVMGVYRPGEKPLWCGFVWRTELISGLHENLADSWLLQMLQGTPFLPWYFRLLGSRIGRRVCMETAWLTEYDLVTVGDDVCLNADCTVQTHLFEDRVMKMDRVDIGDGCSVGTDAVVLYGSRMEARTVLGDLSLLMKGESLPEGTRWEGSPARPAAPLPRIDAATTPAGPAGPTAGLEPHTRTAVRTDTAALGLHCQTLGHDPHGRPRTLGPDGQAWSLSQARAGLAQATALSPTGRVGVDLEPLVSSHALLAAADLLLPSELSWADQGPAATRWRRLLALWTAKEAVLKALGQGFAFDPNQVELGPDGQGGLALHRLCGSEALAAGWRITLEERMVAGRPHLLALAEV